MLQKRRNIAVSLVYNTDFGYTDAAVDGITVPARSYAAQQEVSK